MTHQIITIHDATMPTAYDIPVDLPEGSRLVPQQDGSVAAVDAGRVVGGFEPPWAYDATGMPVRTSFKVSATGLTQVVDHRGARYPVIADPAWFVPVFIVGSKVAIKLSVKALTKSGAKKKALSKARSYGHKVRYAGTPIKGAFKTAGGFNIRIGATPLRKHGFNSFAAFKTRWGSAGQGRDWHHIVEQSSIKISGGRIKPWMVHNRQNVVSIARGIHQQCISALMSTRLRNIPAWQLSRLGIRRTGANAGLTLRQYQAKWSYGNLHLIGLRLLDLCGVDVTGDGI